MNQLHANLKTYLGSPTWRTMNWWKPGIFRFMGNDHLTHAIEASGAIATLGVTGLLRLRVRERHILGDLTKSPTVALTVQSVIGAIAPELILRRTKNRGPFGLGCRVVAVDVVHIAKELNRKTTKLARTLGSFV